ncbi:hypothetical protein SCLCIDRAFT_1219755 [Scleroderma citrinum Foug A]|uniref:Uncharacterized protein n=1 Tax=Scleroderma citrinum Foug A TaxID=1036808 RepID=A0A0C2ZX89_9AGAM|nr:hypothetical protein SCLCIDRAFT_1219755 [Scleroderma citrinum Foug A]
MRYKNIVAVLGRFWNRNGRTFSETYRNAYPYVFNLLINRYQIVIHHKSRWDDLAKASYLKDVR